MRSARDEAERHSLRRSSDELRFLKEVEWGGKTLSSELELLEHNTAPVQDSFSHNSEVQDRILQRTLLLSSSGFSLPALL